MPKDYLTKIAEDISRDKQAVSKFAPPPVIITGYASRRQGQVPQEQPISPEFLRQVTPFQIPQPPMTSERMTASYTPELAQQAERKIAEEERLKTEYPRWVEALSGGAGMFKSRVAYQAQQEAEQLAGARQAEELRTGTNPLIRLANTPTKLGGLTPAQITGIAAIALTGGAAIKDMTAFRRLPEYRQMVSFAKENKIPTSSSQFKSAENLLRTAVNMHRQGAVEAADEIMASYYFALAKTANPAVVTDVGKMIVRYAPAYVPKGTQTGAMAYGGKQFKPEVPPVVPAKVTPVTPEVTSTVPNVQIQGNKVIRDDGLELGILNRSTQMPISKTGAYQGSGSWYAKPVDGRGKYFVNSDNAVKWLERQGRNKLPISRLGEMLGGKPKPEAVTPEVTKISPTYENLTEGQTLVDQAGDRYTITKIEKEGVPAKWAYTVKGITIPDFVQRRPLGEVERYYKIEQPAAIPKAEKLPAKTWTEAGYQPAMIEGVTEKDIQDLELAVGKENVERVRVLANRLIVEEGLGKSEAIESAIRQTPEVQPTAVTPQPVPEVAPQVQPAVTPTTGAMGQPTVQTPAQVPPKPPELQVSPEPIKTPRGINFAPLQDTQSVIDIATKPDASRWVANLPAFKQIMSKVNPSAVANTPAQKAIIVRAVLRDEAMQKSQGITAYLEELGNQRKVFGTLDEKGLISSGNLKGLSVNDIRSYPKKYESKLTTPQKQWIVRAQEIEEAKLDYLKQNDIPINELTFEEGGVYAGRRAYGKVASDGETIDVAFVGAAPRRVGAKLAVEKHRTFKTAKEAIDAGYRYIPEDEALTLNVQGAYYRVADKQMSDWLLTQIPWRTTGAPDELILAAESAKQHVQAVSKLKLALNRAVRGERVPDNTIQSIARIYPQEAQQLKDLIPRIQAGEETAKEVQALTVTAKELHKVDLAILRDAVNARARARERAMTPRIGEAMIMHPAFQGKIFTGSEAKETARILTNELVPQFNKVLGTVNKYNALVRYFKLAGDFSPMMIQLIFLVGENPRIYGDAFVRGIQALAIPKEHAKYLADNKDVIDRHPNLIISSKGTEFTEALTRGGLLRPHITLVPENEKFVKTVTLFAPRVVAKVGRTVLEPFQRFFEASLDDAGIEMAKSMEHLARTPEEVAQLDQFINEFRGLTSSAKLGVSPNWSAAETATLLAPRYNRAIAALLFDAFKGMGAGGLRAKLARNALLKGIGAITLVWIAIGIALGKKPEEIQESIVNGKFTYNVGGVNVGPGTKVRSVAKLVADSASNPDALLQLSMDNPALRFVRGNLAPVPGSAIDILTGRNYIGEPVRDSFGTFTKEILIKQMLPIWVENVLYEGGTPGQRFIRGAGEFWGGRTSPETSWQQAQQLRDRYSLRMYGRKYEDLNNAQKDDLKGRHPDLEVAETIAEEEATRKGTPVERFYYGEKERITKARNDALNKAAESLLAGQISKYDYDKERGYIRPYYSGGREVLWSVRESFDEYSVKQMEKWLNENQKPEDKALNEYQEYRAELIEKADLPRDWDIIERETSRFMTKYSPTIRAYILANQDAWLKDLPSAARQIEEMRAQGIEDESWWNNYRTAGRSRIGQVPSTQQAPPVIIRGYAGSRK